MSPLDRVVFLVLGLSLAGSSAIADRPSPESSGGQVRHLEDRSTPPAAAISPASGLETLLAEVLKAHGIPRPPTAPSRRSYASAVSSTGSPEETTVSLDGAANASGVGTVQDVIEWDSDGDGAWESRITYKAYFDSHGRRIRFDYRTEAAADNLPDWGWTETRAYDAHGNLVSFRNEGDDTGDGVVDWRHAVDVTYETASGLPSVILYEIDSNGDGLVDERSTTTFTVDARHDVVAMERRDDNGTLEYRATWEYAEGHRILRATSTYFYQPNDYDEFAETTYSYDGRHRLLREVVRYTGHHVGQRSTTTEYDQHSNVIRLVRSTDFDTDDMLLRTTTVSAYDARGRLVRQEERQIDLGHNDEWLHTIARAFAYDQHDRLVTREENVAQDWSPARTNTREQVAYDDGVVRSVTETDDDVDGIVDSRITITRLLDGLGRTTSLVLEFDRDADGRPESIRSQRTEFSGNSHLPGIRAAASEPLLPDGGMSLRAVDSNPFRGSVTLRCTTESGGAVKLSIYDVSGRVVRTLADERTEAGERQFRWDGRDEQGTQVGPGVYLARARAAGREATRILVRLD